MTDLRKAAEQALEALGGIHPGNMTPMAEESWNKAAEALRQALAQPVDAINMSEERVDETDKREQEPVAWFRYESSYEYQNQLTRCTKDCIGAFPVYTAPPKREWVGLTDEEREHFRGLGFVGVLAVEAKLKEKNGG